MKQRSFNRSKSQGSVGYEFDAAIGNVEVVGHAIHHVDGRIGREKFGYARERTRVIDIIGVQPADDVAVGRPDPLVYRVRLTLVLFRNPSSAATGGLEYRQGIIRAGTIHHQMLDRSPGLDCHAFQRSTDELPLIERGGYYGYLHGIGNSSVRPPLARMILQRTNKAESSR